jgi:hypothetical protein
VRAALKGKKNIPCANRLRQNPLVPIGPGHTDIFPAAWSLAVGSSSTVTPTAVIGYGSGFGSPWGWASWWAEEGREGSVSFFSWCFLLEGSGMRGDGPWDTCRPSGHGTRVDRRATGAWCDKIFICTIFFLFPFQWHIRMSLCQQPTFYVVQQTSRIRMVLYVPIYRETDRFNFGCLKASTFNDY